MPGIHQITDCLKQSLRGGDGGGRVEDVAIFIRNDKNGQDQE